MAAMDHSDPLWVLQDECAAWHRAELRRRASESRGVVIAADWEQLPGAYVCVRSLRKFGCTLPVQIWHMRELLPCMQRAMDGLGVEWCKADSSHGWACKSHAVRMSHYEEVLLLDADNVPVADVTALFPVNGLTLWHTGRPAKERSWAAWGFPPTAEPLADTGQVLVSKATHGRTVALADWLNQQHRYTYRTMLGDTLSWQVAAKATGQAYELLGPCEVVGNSIVYGMDGSELFQHRLAAKFLSGRPYARNDLLPGEDERHEWLREFDQIVR